MKSLILIAVIAALFLLTVGVGIVCADGSGNLGITFNQVIDDRSGGLDLNYEYDGDPLDIEFDSTLQFGDAYKGKIHTEFLFDVGAVGAKVIAETTAKGYELNDMGRNNTIAVALNIPTGDLSFDIGIGGNNAAPWATPNAFNTLVGDGFAEGDLEGLGLESISKGATGIPFRDGSFIQVFIATELEKGNMDIDLKGIIDVIGEDKAQQVNAGFQTSRDFGNVSVIGRVEFGLMALDGVVYYETATTLSVGIPF